QKRQSPLLLLLHPTVLRPRRRPRRRKPILLPGQPRPVRLRHLRDPRGQGLEVCRVRGRPDGFQREEGGQGGAGAGGVVKEEALCEGGGVVCGELERLEECGGSREDGGYVADVGGGEGGVAPGGF